MKHLILTAAFALSATCIFASNKTMSTGDWSNYGEVEKQIQKTSFIDHTYNIKDFGAKEYGQGNTAPCQDAINLAIVTCSKAGGGIVEVPAGTFYTGPITLKSNVNLHLDKGALLKFSTDQSLYFPAVLTRWEGLDCYNAHPLLYAYGETNIAITGEGVIDGQGSNKAWWPMCGSLKYGYIKGEITQRNGGRARLEMYGENEVPIYKRVMKPEDGLRPQLINIVQSNRVLIQGVTLLNSPFWVIHPLLSENIVVDGVKINNHAPNGDGCDPESCKNVLIENCSFVTGDDCIAIKSGRNFDGRKWGIPSENMIIRNCEMKDGHGGVVIGSEISGGFKNLYVENCNMDSPNLARVLRIKTNTCRGGVIENVNMRNINVGQCGEAVVIIDLDYEHDEDCHRGFIPTVRNVFVDNVTCKQSNRGVYIIGLKNNIQVYNINVTNSKFTGVKGTPVSIIGAKDVNFSNLFINGKEIK